MKHANERVAIGVPVLKGLLGVMVQPLMGCAIEVGRQHPTVLLVPVDQAPHDRAREMVMTKAKDHHCDLLLWVDSDNPPPPGGFDKLYDTMKSHNAVMVAGYYFMRGPPFLPHWTKIVNDPNGDGSDTDMCTKVFAEPTDPPIALDTCGCGFVLLDLRWVWEHLSPPYYGFGKTPDGQHIWEDVEFCLKVREAGGIIIGDPSVRVSHLSDPIEICDETVMYLRGKYVQAKVAEDSHRQKETEQWQSQLAQT